MSVCVLFQTNVFICKIIFVSIYSYTHIHVVDLFYFISKFGLDSAASLTNEIKVKKALFDFLFGSKTFQLNKWKTINMEVIVVDMSLFESMTVYICTVRSRNDYIFVHSVCDKIKNNEVDLNIFLLFIIHINKLIYNSKLKTSSI